MNGCVQKSFSKGEKKNVYRRKQETLQTGSTPFLAYLQKTYFLSPSFIKQINSSHVLELQAVLCCAAFAAMVDGLEN
jgi:hypothetical protein